jgi:hypothetical protein
MFLNSAIIGLIFLTVAATTTAQTITYQQFLDVPIGATLEQITQLLNNSGQIISLTLQYTNTNPFGDALFILTNNQLTTKSQSGLTQNQYPITLAQYNQITIGMTIAQVTSLVGNGGQVVGEGTDSILIVSYNGNQFASLAQITYMWQVSLEFS